MNTDNLIIDSSNLDIVKEVCKFIKNDNIRNRAVANALGAEIAKKYFTDLEIDTTCCLHEIPQILDKIDISDIYIKNNYIDVRLYFENTSPQIPLCHFKNNILPLAYMFIKVDEELSGGLVTGFITPASIDITDSNAGYITLEEEQLQSFYDIEGQLAQEEVLYLEDEIECKLYDLIDNNFENDNDLYRILIKSPDAREKLKNIAKAKMVFNFVSIPNKVATDKVNSEATNSEFLFDNSKDTEITDISLDNTELLTEENTNLSLVDTAEDLIIQEDIDTEINSTDEININEENIDNYNIETATESIQSEIIEEPITSFEYSTTTTPSLNNYEEIETVANIDEEELLSILNSEEATISDNTESDAEKDESLMGEDTDEEVQISNEENNNSEIDSLFNNHEEDSTIEEYEEQVKTKKNNPIALIGLALAIITVSYYGYNKFTSNSQITPSKKVQQSVKNTESHKNKSIATPMPNESVENKDNTNFSEEGTVDTIPSIEKNLDASILISNLSINWDIPSGYVSSNTAKRYLLKIGKIIQLNLKTELLLLSKPPLTNIIKVELEFDNNSNKFNFKQFITSSGEKIVDSVITNTIKKALDINLNMNMSTFENISGNPILIIRL